MDDQEILQEFLTESYENLATLDHELVELEKRPQDAELLASVFRTIHTIKGTCGFLGFSTMEKISHVTENILSQARNGERLLTAEVNSVIFAAVDAIKNELRSIEERQAESGQSYDALIATLQDVYENRSGDAVPARAERKEVPRQSAGEKEPPAAAVLAPPSERPQETAPTPQDAVGNLTGSLLSESTIRVNVHLLDKMMNLVGELVLARNQILQFFTHSMDGAFRQSGQRLDIITTELQASVMKTRMQPVGQVWKRLPRIVRDLATSLGKPVELEMEGGETELDKSVIEAIQDPLIHILRNACDHGIEDPATRLAAGKPATGTVRLRAHHESGNVIIEISDDGRGMDAAKLRTKAVEKRLMAPEQAAALTDREAINLIFLPGFSTASQVTNVSGRGVGMDVVKRNIERIGGIVDLSTVTGKGTTLKIKIPLTLAIIPGLVVSAGGQRFVIPQVTLVELLRIGEGPGCQTIEQVQGAPVFRRRGRLLPVVHLDRVLEMIGAGGGEGKLAVLQIDEHTFGLVVDEVEDTQEIVVKPLSPLLQAIHAYAGSTIMGDGRVALILDVRGIAHRAGLTASQAASRASRETERIHAVEKQSYLIFRSGSLTRLAVPLGLLARLEEIPVSSVEFSGGRMVVQYRGEILQLVPLADLMGACGSQQGGPPEKYNVLVFHDRHYRIGFIVDEILDIVDDTPSVRQAARRQGLLGSAVIDGRVTDLLDVQGLIQIAAGDWFQHNSGSIRRPVTVLIADHSPFSRALIRTHLEVAGYQVLEAGSFREAADKLNRLHVDIVAAAEDLSPSGALELKNFIERSNSLCHLPVVLLGEAEASLLAHPDAGLPALLSKFDREALLGSVRKLAEALEPAGVPAKLNTPTEQVQ